MTAMLAGVASGLGGRFFEELRDKQSLCYTVHASASERRAAGTFLTYVATSPENVTYSSGFWPMSLNLNPAYVASHWESVEQGAAFGYPLWSLPLARLAKGYSWVLNRFGAVGPVPEGMSATVALRARWLVARHEVLKQSVIERSRAFQQQHGYRAPFWRLFTFAQEAAGDVEWDGG